jgi:hypothetical protein
VAAPAAPALPAAPAAPAAPVDRARSPRKGKDSKRSRSEKHRNLPQEFSELPTTSPPLTEAELLAQKERRAKMRQEKKKKI